MSASTLNGHRVTAGRVFIPKWGCWFVEASIDGEFVLNGDVEVQVADLALKGAVISGGPAKGRSGYRVIGGKGGWGKTIDAWSYVDDAGVKKSTILQDAARRAGETLAAIPPTERVGPRWTRAEGPASHDLELLAPGAWYVDEAGVTRLGARPPGELVGKVTRVTPVDLARGKLVLAAESIATILPGLVVDGLTAVDVLHEISADGGLRSTIWAAQAPGPIDALRALMLQLDPNRNFRGVTEYRIGSRSGALYNVQPVRVSSGMPTLSRVPVWPGIPGCSQTAPIGSRVLVGFIDSDPDRPYIGQFLGDTASSGLELVTDGVGAGGHAITLEQVLGLFAQYTAARYLLGDLGMTFSAAYSAAPPASLATLMASMIAGATLPATPVGPTPGSVLDALGLPALIETALEAQLPDPASLGLPTPVIPGLAKKGFRL